MTERRPRRHLSPHTTGDVLHQLFLCGRCTILFSSREAQTILSGEAGVCSNCGAWNQM